MRCHPLSDTCIYHRSILHGSCACPVYVIVVTMRVIIFSHITFCLPIVVARMSSTHQCTRIAYTTRRSTSINNIMLMIIKKYPSIIITIVYPKYNITIYYSYALDNIEKIMVILKLLYLMIIYYIRIINL